MASWDPGRNDTIDDSLPTIACPVSRSVHTFMDNHVAACSVCTAHELEHGRANSPGQMCASCPDNIGLVAHRLRTGYSPHFEYSPALVQEDNRGSCGKFFASTCAAMDKMDGIEGHFAPERREDQPPNTVGLLTVVRDKHMHARGSRRRLANRSCGQAAEGTRRHRLHGPRHERRAHTLALPPRRRR